MEELRSTAILDREIQDDARRKAEKILKASESECRAILEDVTYRISLIKAQKEAEYASRLASYVKDSESAIPLEKQRRLVTFIDISVQEALDKWFAEIGSEKRLVLFSHLLEKYKIILADRKLKVRYIAYSEDSIYKTVAGFFGSASIESLTEISAAEAQAEGFHDGLLVDSSDSLIKCRATLSEIRCDLLSVKRQELAEALMGGRLPE